jgi:hypothetical protein
MSGNVTRRRRLPAALLFSCSTAPAPLPQPRRSHLTFRNASFSDFFARTPNLQAPADRRKREGPAAMSDETSASSVDP